MKIWMSMTLLLLMTVFVFGGDMLKPGDKAPDFALTDADGKEHKLSDYRGDIVALYFYPKDDSPGCTAQACNLRDNHEALMNEDVVVLGVSFDDQESHKKFAEKYDLPFTILSDTKKKVAEMYGAKGAITGFLVAKRVTFLIDEDGVIFDVIEEVDTGNHTAQILKAIKEHNKS